MTVAYNYTQWELNKQLQVFKRHVFNFVNTCTSIQCIGILTKILVYLDFSHFSTIHSIGLC